MSDVTSEKTIKLLVGAYLKEMRVRRKISLGDMALAVGKTKSYVCDVENGRRGGSRMAADLVALWADYLDIPVSSIVERQKQKETPTNIIIASPKYRSYLRILRNKKRSKRIHKAITDMRDLLSMSYSELTHSQVRDMMSKLTENVNIIDTCLEYSR
jgi:transcriptional regulator with XRE-family HTH domain